MEQAKVYNALSKAQAQFTHAPKDSTNSHFKSTYADLASVWNAIRKPLTDNGLSVTQGYEVKGGILCLVTMLLHDSGAFIEFNYPIYLPADKMTNPQQLGGAMTYARRYALAAIVGIAQDDDDGNSISLPPDTHAQSGGGYAGPVVNHAPGADNGAALSAYRITFGKYKNKTMDEVGPNDIANYCEYIERKAKEDNKPIKGNVAEFLTLADSYLAGCTPAFDPNEEVPNF